MIEDEPMYQLVNRGTCSGSDFMRLLMERTGDGEKVTVRELAASVGVSHGTIGNLLTGQTIRLPYEPARQAAERLGVDFAVLWVEVGRSVRALHTQHGHRHSQVPA